MKYTFDEIWEMAAPILEECGINVNNKNVGFWAKLNHFRRCKEQRNNIISVWYEKY